MGEMSSRIAQRVSFVESACRLTERFPALSLKKRPFAGALTARICLQRTTMLSLPRFIKSKSAPAARNSFTTSPQAMPLVYGEISTQFSLRPTANLTFIPISGFSLICMLPAG